MNSPELPFILLGIGMLPAIIYTIHYMIYRKHIRENFVKRYKERLKIIALRNEEETKEKVVNELIQLSTEVKERIITPELGAPENILRYEREGLIAEVNKLTREKYYFRDLITSIENAAKAKDPNLLTHVITILSNKLENRVVR